MPTTRANALVLSTDCTNSYFYCIGLVFAYTTPVPHPGYRALLFEENSSNDYVEFDSYLKVLSMSLPISDSISRRRSFFRFSGTSS